VRALFVRPNAEEMKRYVPEFTILSAPEFQADPQRDGTRSEAFIVVNFTRKIILIGGTKYAGEMKKSVFGIMNFLLPERNVFPMHCSANVGKQGDTALFFGLSGTGKTTLSADPERLLIGDDEHGWSPRGIFNFEGGCYAKCIKLSRENEPQIWNAIRFGSVLENVTLDPVTHTPDYNDDSRTENTRCAYPVDYIDGAVIPGIGTHPKTVIFLTADAFGVLPPISKLNSDQAMYHFLSGYTAKVAGTEAGIKEPQPNFSTCFGAPFLPLRPKVYAEMLGRRIQEHHAQCWLVNTGWFGGPFGTGERMKLAYTRSMVRAAIDGQLRNAEFTVEPAFGFTIPRTCPGVPPEFLDARGAWKDKAAYDKAAADLSTRFAKNFEKFEVPENIRTSGPKAK
jgi:phosphoenolpyruvate carboxykinase (ATP)